MSNCPLFHLHCNDLKQSESILAEALDAASFALLHGDRPQQIESGNAARSLLTVKGYSVRPSKLRCFNIQAQFDGILSTCTWKERGLTSIDALFSVIEQIESHPRFAGKCLSITVLPETGIKGHSND